MRDAVTAARTTHPQAVERLRQHISVRSVMAGLPAEVIIKGMGTSRKDAYFWRLLARGMEAVGQLPRRCSGIASSLMPYTKN